jgi:hypothetical protein
MCETLQAQAHQIRTISIIPISTINHFKGASFGIQKNSLLHGNYISNSSIIINIIVNGQNKSLGEDDDNAMIFRLIEEVVDDVDIGEEVEESEETTTDEALSQSYEEIDGSIPIAKGPLRIENPEKIPLLNGGGGGWKAEN